MLDQWARDWGVSAPALFALRVLMGNAPIAPVAIVGTPGSEARQQSLVRIDAAKNGVWLTRNNVGVLFDDNGRPVRFGLANESKEQNTSVKSGDLIGIKPVLIGPQHMGTLIGQFVSREIKHEGWRFNPKDKHEKAQQNWINFVVSKGGDASFAIGPGSFLNKR